MSGRALLVALLAGALCASCSSAPAPAPTDGGSVIFALRDGHFTTHYSRTFIEAGQKAPQVPPMSAIQWEALDVLHEIADELCLTMRFEPGDIQFLNNHVLFHARTAYEDSGATRRRLLYRMWLSMANSRPLPPGHGVLFGATGAGAIRGGIAQATGETHPRPS